VSSHPLKHYDVEFQVVELWSEIETRSNENILDILQLESSTIKLIIEPVIGCHLINSSIKYDFACIVLRKFETVRSARTQGGEIKL
jgi:hypothetical protein